MEVWHTQACSQASNLEHTAAKYRYDYLQETIRVKCAIANQEFPFSSELKGLKRCTNKHLQVIE